MVKWLLYKCIKCERYTLNNDKCPYCGGEVHSPHPAKFSLNDKYLSYKTKGKHGETNFQIIQENELT